MNPIAVVHWIDVDGIERSMTFYNDGALKVFTESLRKGDVCYWTCVCGANVPYDPPRSLVERVSWSG